MKAWWNGLDNDVKQIMFVVGTFLASLYLATIGLWVATGYPWAFVTVACVSGALFSLFGLVKLAEAVFPTKETKR
ncbi:hypothetical protein [Dactylosporangium sp. CA-139066]|uniref:hypothetical protein n=1 Tax=Dactylosporangium sp. CA-139066 TaxID=3239930 RepID=UPI003D907920